SDTGSKLPSRQEILEQAGLWPLPEHRPGVPAIIAHGRNRSGYSVENVALETAAGCYITGNLYRPLLRHDLGPAVLVVDEPEGETMTSHSAVTRFTRRLHGILT